MILGFKTILHPYIFLLQAGPHIDIAAGADQGGGWGVVLDILLVLMLLGGVVALGYFALQFYRSRAVVRPGVSAEQAMSRDVRARVKKAMDRQEFEAAGDLLALAGMHDEAAEVYVRAKSFARAARSYQAAGKVSQAIHCFKRAGDFEQSARLYADSGDHRAAAAEFVQAGNPAAAAQQYEKAGDHQHAARHYRQVGALFEAARSYDASGDPRAAAECFAGYVDEVLQGRTLEAYAQASADEAQRAQVRHAARRAGEVWQQLGAWEEAAQAFVRAQLWAQAAECRRQQANWSAAADLYLKAGEPLKAAEVLEEGGDAERAARMRAEAALAQGDRLEAARMMQAAGEVGRAAQLFEELGEFAQAAALLEQAGEFERAADLYARADKHGLEARAAEQAGLLARAADAYRAAGDVESEIRLRTAQGDYFRAGRLLFEHRRFVDALDMLDRIDSSAAIYPRALELAGDIYFAQGRYERAFSRFKSALGQREIDAAMLPLVYKMARALEEEKDFSGAMEHFGYVTGVDQAFEDAAARLQALRGKIRRSSLTTATGSGPFGAPTATPGALPRRYEIISEVARGGMGVVYKARDTVLGRIVAFKILGENLKDNQVAVKYFLREARAAAALSHPNIVTIYDAGEQDGEYYMAMEFVEGTTLKQLVQKKGALQENQVRYVLDYCCRALDYAHNKGVVHRDIKSGNVMLATDKSLKIMDFGLAKFLREYQNNHTQQVGTPFYMSPEQIIGKELDFRSDLYSLGCTIFECATGQVPFGKGDLSYHHLHTAPPRPRELNPALSADIEAVILKLLAKNPDERFQSAREVLGQVARS